MKTIFRFLLIFVSLIFFGCKNPVLFNEYKSIPNEGWSKDQKVKFELQIIDTQNYYNLYLNLRITGDYLWSNMFVLVHLIGPEGSHSAEKIEVTLATPDGKWLGSGMGDLISYQLPLITNKVFTKKGTYKIEIEQYMRMDFMPYVRDVGLKVRKGEEII